MLRYVTFSLCYATFCRSIVYNTFDLPWNVTHRSAPLFWRPPFILPPQGGGLGGGDGGDSGVQRAQGMVRSDYWSISILKKKLIHFKEIEEEANAGDLFTMYHSLPPPKKKIKYAPGLIAKDL
jgi:hypothetical protein